MSRIFFILVFIVVFIVTLGACRDNTANPVKFVVKYQNTLQTCLEAEQGLMFYLSGFSTENAIALIPSSYSSDTVALIGGNCSEQAWQLQLADEVKPGQSLSFELAVPFNQNHGNPLTADKPLNVSEMFWSWQLGHKFLRLDLASFSFHLGSTGCKSPSTMRAPKDTCRFPNRFRYTLTDFDHAKAVVFDLDALLNHVDTTRSCMSEQDNKTCQQLFTNLSTELFYQEHNANN